MLAREYGYAGWQELSAEVQRRVGDDLGWAVSQARRIIHDNDVTRLQQLIAEYPALLSWRDGQNDGGLLGMAASSFGDSFDPFREHHFTRPQCAEVLIDAGAVVAPSVCDGLMAARAKGLLELFHRKRVLPRTLKFLAARGDLDDVRAWLSDNVADLPMVNEAFMCAARLEHEEVATLLLERAIALDGELGRHIDQGPGRLPFIKHIAERALDFTDAAPEGPWQAFRMHQVMCAIHDDDLDTFVSELQREPWLLDAARVGFQVGMIERATLRDRARFIGALLDLEPALSRRTPPPPSQAIEFAFAYAKAHLIPMLVRIWPLPHDLPHAAGIGDLTAVKGWFDEAGKPRLGDLADHFPANNEHARMNLQWGAPTVQHVLDTALAWAVVNGRFEIADFLLEHGANINTTWSSHEPASILHELVFHENYEAMQFLIDRGIDMTIVDHRWGGTAEGWAYHAAKNEKMAQWLGDAEHKREGRTR